MNKKVQGPLVAIQLLSILQLLANPRTQSRVALNQGKIDEYAELMKDGVEFPPVIVFFDGKDYFVGGGFHRLNAALKAGFAEFPAEVRQGTERDAKFFSVADNVRNGAALTPEDRRNGARILLLDPEWSKWGDKEIARHSGNSVAQVKKLRDELVAVNPNLAAPVRMVQRKGGKPYAMKVSEIGQKKVSKKAPTGKTVKEDVVNETVTASAQPIAEPVVPAVVTEPADKAEQEQADKHDDLIEVIDAQVIEPDTEEKEERVPPAATPNATPQRYGDRFQVVLGEQKSFEGCEGIFIVFGRKNELKLDVIHKMCVKNDATVLATPVAAMKWKFQILTDKEREAIAAEAGV